MTAAAAMLVIAGLAAFFLWPRDSDPGSSATPDQISKPTGMSVGPDGQVFIADEERHRVIRVSTSGKTTVVAGTGTEGDGGDGDLATDASLSFPSDVAVASTGEVYIASAGRVRVVDTDGVIQRILDLPDGVRRIGLDAKDTLYVADKAAVWRREPTGQSDPTRHRIVRVQDGKPIRIAGLSSQASTPLVDGFPARESAVISPVGLTYASDGTLYWSELGNNRVRMLSADGKVRTVAGNPEGYSEGGDSGDGGPGRDATLVLKDGPLAVTDDGTLYIGDVGNGRVRRLEKDGTIDAFA